MRFLSTALTAFAVTIPSGGCPICLPPSAGSGMGGLTHAEKTTAHGREASLQTEP
jgi:hypothetical protein